MKIIERTSKEVDKETVELFEQAKPYLDAGMGYIKSIRMVKQMPESSNFQGNSWYKRFKAYAKEQGYKPLK